jgi:hypothetical protein
LEQARLPLWVRLAGERAPSWDEKPAPAARSADKPPTRIQGRRLPPPLAPAARLRRVPRRRPCSLVLRVHQRTSPSAAPG